MQDTGQPEGRAVIDWVFLALAMMAFRRKTDLGRSARGAALMPVIVQGSRLPNGVGLRRVDALEQARRPAQRRAELQAMILDAIGALWSSAMFRFPCRGRSGAPSCRGLRGLPHRPAYRGRRPCGGKAPVDPGPRGRWPHRRRGTGGGPACPWAACRRALAWCDLRAVFLLPERCRESVRCAAVHRLYPRRRVCRILRRGCGPCLRPVRDGGSGCPCAPSLCRADRLPGAAYGGVGAKAGDLGLLVRQRISFARSPSGKGARSVPSPAPATPPRRPSRATWAPHGPGTRTRRRLTCLTPR